MTGENVMCQGWAALLHKVSPETGGVQVPVELKEYIVWGWGVGPQCRWVALCCGAAMGAAEGEGGTLHTIWCVCVCLATFTEHTHTPCGWDFGVCFDGRAQWMKEETRELEVYGKVILSLTTESEQEQGGCEE